jgi:NDP-sugar pyrophosphorylase family protein
MVPDIDEVILSLNYQPDRIESVLGDGRDVGIRIRYVVEPEPLGTGGAIKFAARGVNDTVVVFNGDVLTEIDLPEVIALHRARTAKATIVLTPVDNPTAYGLVETDAQGNIRRFLEKPKPDEITTNNINAGIYVLEPSTFDRIPDGVPYSIERGYFPSLVERGETFLAYVYAGYWIDIGTPEKYVQVHRDVMDGRFGAGPFRTRDRRRLIAADARIDPSATIAEPCFIGAGVVVGPSAYITAHSVIGAGSVIGEGATVDGAILWPGCQIGPHATVGPAIIGRSGRVEAHATVSGGAVLGDDSTLTSYSKT